MASHRVCFRETPEFEVLINCNRKLVINLPTQFIFQHLLANGIIEKDAMQGLPMDDTANKIKNQQFLLSLQSKSIEDFYQFLTILTRDDSPRQDLADYLKDELRQQIGPITVSSDEEDEIKLKEQIAEDNEEEEEEQTAESGTASLSLSDEEEVIYSQEKGNEISPSTCSSMPISVEKKTTVYAWGANRYSQLGGINLKEDTVLVPTVNEIMSNLKPNMMTAGLGCTFIVTNDGCIYVCGHGQDGRLGLGTVNHVVIPRPIYLKVFITKVASFYCGQHALALTGNGIVLSWGSNIYGQLGHGHCRNVIHPTVIDTISSKHIVDIACGSDSSAAISDSGELFTWGCGFQGCLGHGDTETYKLPKKVEAFKDYHVSKIACGCWHMLAIVNQNRIWSWGHGHYGQLGNGQSANCLQPILVEQLPHILWAKVICGWDISFALSQDGYIWSWGYNGDFMVNECSRLIVDEPQLLYRLADQDKKIVDLGASNCHCVALAADGELYLWGANDKGRLGNGSDIKDCNFPKPCTALADVKLTHLGCVAAHCTAWRAE
ncbi:E3 ubiquitin-protein ligase HERC2 [Trichoplax sp. H2]|nr:E3 ubiquitin-protein ligase HERC2 [Trichoplax sp. H2]|eukprot:RDD42658.1 E3 ubiquitin-protein ligase HERC2 [Trichoplax sp. H2]